MVPVAGGRAAQGSGAHGGQDASTRLLSTLLTEMDGLESATGAAPVICSKQVILAADWMCRLNDHITCGAIQAHAQAPRICSFGAHICL